MDNFHFKMWFELLSKRLNYLDLIQVISTVCRREDDAFILINVSHKHGRTDLRDIYCYRAYQYDVSFRS